MLREAGAETAMSMDCTYASHWLREAGAEAVNAHGSTISFFKTITLVRVNYAKILTKQPLKGTPT